MYPEKNHKRIEWIDLCKFIAIFYMVWGHVGMTAPMDQYIHVFHMPIFFFLSGYVLNLDKVANFKTYLIKKTKTLLIPYFVFAIGLYYFWFAVYKIAGKPCPENQLTFWKGLFTYNTIISPFGSIQWFLTCLFIVEILFYVLAKMAKRHPIILLPTLAAASLIGYFYAICVPFRLFWGADTALTALVFYGMGYLLNNHDNFVKTFIFSPTPLKLTVFCAMSIITAFLNENVNMRTIQYGNYFLYYLSSISSIIFYVMLSMYVCEEKRANKPEFYKWLLFIGQNTIVVLVTNDLFIQLLQIFKQILPILDNWGINIVYAVMILILMIPIAFLLNKYLPWTIGKKRKNLSIVS